MENIESLELKSINFSRDNMSILKDFNYSFSFDKTYIIHGQSGIGKTTLSKIISGHLTPSSGEVVLNGTNITGVFGRHAFLVHQNDDLFPWLRVKDSLDPKNSDNLNILETLNILKLSEKYPHQLSGGEKKRLSLARGLSFSTKVIIIDEALSSIDSGQRKEVISDLKELTRGKLVIFISHYPEDFSEINPIPILLT